MRTQQSEDPYVLALERRVRELEKWRANNTSAGLAWDGYMIHGNAASIGQVVRLLTEKKHEATL